MAFEWEHHPTRPFHRIWVKWMEMKWAFERGREALDPSETDLNFNRSLKVQYEVFPVYVCTVHICMVSFPVFMWFFSLRAELKCSDSNLCACTLIAAACYLHSSFSSFPSNSHCFCYVCPLYTHIWCDDIGRDLDVELKPFLFNCSAKQCIYCYFLMIAFCSWLNNHLCQNTIIVTLWYDTFSTVSHLATLVHMLRMLLCVSATAQQPCSPSPSTLTGAI